ncbi:MAG: biopolymer transporter ExbD [Pseudomonadota bacterium]
MQRMRRKKKGEPTIALINIVFLMLIFFLVAGTVAQPLDGDLKLVETSDLEGREPPDAIVIREDGTLSYRGEPVGDTRALAQRFSPEQLQRVKVVPDRELDASRLVEVSRDLRALGASSVVIVTERALQ